jgi:predicted CXXCH cytochrome family protein
MRTRTAKKLAQRIDLNYFKRAQGMRRWKGLLSLVIPVAALVWLGTLAAAGNRTVYSSGPVSSAHAFVEAKCEVCHTPADTSFRAHVTDTACLTCHDAPSHPPSATQATAAHGTPACATCHRDHQGRVQLAATADRFCVDCHGDLELVAGTPSIQTAVGSFPAGHPEFATLRPGVKDPGTIRFNHEVHARDGLPGPDGGEKLECATCHKPEVTRVSSRRPSVTGLMAAVSYEQQCARCHPLFFDERLEAVVPHEQPAAIRAFVRQSLTEYIAAHPGAISEPDGPNRRIPLNFPRPQEPPARTPEEWVQRRAGRAEQYLWGKACKDCHAVTGPTSAGALPQIAPASLQTQWMPRARFDHAPHLMVECASCHTGVEKSRETADVLMPAVATCATCHSPSKGAASRCVECHGYHDWTKSRPVKPHFTLTDFQ